MSDNKLRPQIIKSEVCMDRLQYELWNKDETFKAVVKDELDHRLLEQIRERVDGQEVIVMMYSIENEYEPFIDQHMVKRSALVRDLIRCKNCMFHNPEDGTCEFSRVDYSPKVDDNFFCGNGVKTGNEVLAFLLGSSHMDEDEYQHGWNDAIDAIAMRSEDERR